jgi:hypothetical protein
VDVPKVFTMPAPTSAPAPAPSSSAAAPAVDQARADASAKSARATAKASRSDTDEAERAFKALKKVSDGDDKQANALKDAACETRLGGKWICLRPLDSGY